MKSSEFNFIAAMLCYIMSEVQGSLYFGIMGAIFTVMMLVDLFLDWRLDRYKKKAAR